MKVTDVEDGETRSPHDSKQLRAYGQMGCESSRWLYP
jgi:hypothetical protein